MSERYRLWRAKGTDGVNSVGRIILEPAVEGAHCEAYADWEPIDPCQIVPHAPQPAQPQGEQPSSVAPLPPGVCKECAGSGQDHPASAKYRNTDDDTCPRCKGTGKEPSVQGAVGEASPQDSEPLWKHWLNQTAGNPNDIAHYLALQVLEHLADLQRQLAVANSLRAAREAANAEIERLKGVTLEEMRQRAERAEAERERATNLYHRPITSCRRRLPYRRQARQRRGRD